MKIYTSEGNEEAMYDILLTVNNEAFRGMLLKTQAALTLKNYRQR